MIAGLVLTDSEEKDSALAFIGEETSSYSIKDTGEIVEKIREKDPVLIAADVGLEQRKDELTEQEEKLKEKGFSFTPTHAETKKVKRLQAIKGVLDRDLEEAPDFIRFDPFITARELAIESESAFESYGVDTECLGSSREFDALLGAVTARFYQQNQYQDLGVIVPDTLEE